MMEQELGQYTMLSGTDIHTTDCFRGPQFRWHRDEDGG